MKKQRLLKLADLLVADASREKGIKFNISVVAESGTAEGGAMKLDCGTEACAIGLAALSGSFKSAGLSYEVEPNPRGEGHRIVTLMHDEQVEWSDAAADVFGLSHDEVEFLFTGWRNPEGMHRGAAAERFVAKRIRDFVAGKVAP
jgi:hypothetical protein